MSEHVQEEFLETISDLELLLLSWTQMVAVEMIVADEESQAAKSELASQLLDQFGVTDIRLIQRDLQHYSVAYTQNGETKSIRFETDEVESIYDL